MHAESSNAGGFSLSLKMRGKVDEARPLCKKPAAKDVAPKVVEVYDHLPGVRPRKVTVERRKKWFESLDFETLLLERGISFRSPEATADHWLNVDCFDSTEFDIRTPEQWMEHGYADDGSFLPLKATALRVSEHGEGLWKECLVCGWEPPATVQDTGYFQVRWTEDEAAATTESVSRLKICFHGEDPSLFADRVEFAFNAVQRAQARAKLNFFIDNMPIDDIQCLDVDQVARVLDLSKRSPALRDASLEAASNDLIREVNLDFARTMNKIVILHESQEQGRNDEDADVGGCHSSNDATMLFGGLDASHLDDEDENSFDKPVLWFALWPVPEYNFTETFSTFCFVSLYIRTEVVTTLCSVAKECLDLMGHCIYTTKFQKSMRLEQFRQLQKNTISHTSKHIREKWNVDLQHIVHANFKSVGKGWFSLHETNVDTYRQGKLRKMLQVIRFMMEDSLRFFALDSAADFCFGVQRMCPDTVNVHNLLKIESTFKPAPAPAPALRGGSLELSPPGKAHLLDQSKVLDFDHLKPGKPLFALEVKTTDDKEHFAYSLEPKAHSDASGEILDMGLQSLADVQQIEPSIVPQLFKTVVVKKVLNVVDVHNDWVKGRREELKAMIGKGLDALDDYLALLAPYEELLCLDPAAYVEAKAEADISTEETKTLINEHQQSNNEITNAIPDSVTVGLFEVHLAEIRKVLAGRHQKIKELLMESLTVKFRDGCQEICDSFTGIYSQLRKGPKDIEGVTEMREYMASVPSEILKMSPEIKKCLDTYVALENLGVRMSNDDNGQRWRLFGSPKQTYDMMDQVEESLVELERSFLDAQAAEQTEFDEELADMAGTIESFSRYSNLEEIDGIFENVESVNERLKKATAAVKMFNSREQLFGKEVTDYSTLQQLQKEWEPFSQMWITTYHWIQDSKKWNEGAFNKIDSKHCEAAIQTGTKTLFKAVKQLEKRDDCEAVLQIAKDIKTQIDDFAPTVPLILGLRNAGMRDRHWEQVSELVGSTIHPDMENFTLANFLELDMLKKADAIGDIGDRSGKELSIENQLNNMKAAWEKVFFDCSEPYRTTGTFVLKGADDVMALLDEQIVVTQAMQFSPFNKPFKEDIDEWNDKLNYISEALEQWLKVQRAWMYLQPIFDSADIMKQLPTEGKKFKGVDTKWRTAMGKVHTNGHALTACTQEGLLEMWMLCNKDLDLVQKGLDDYLETKRGAFARFYFLSNDELLEILSQTKDPLRVQPFLSKVFEAMQKLTFTPELEATQMHSKEGEVIDFVSNVVTKGNNVEVWMTDVENQMIRAIREAFKIGVETYIEKARPQWVLDNPGQIVLNSSQVFWTAETEAAIKADTTQQYFEKLAGQLLDLVHLVRGKVTKLQRTSIGALVLIDVHAKDVCENIAKERITDPMSFEWISQLRFYWEVDDRKEENCWVRMVQTPFPYGYEYLGNSFRLVITPLTDMCYMTLMGAQSLNLGGAPAGPAGTGKTESTKDLAKALAKQCVVFNCSPEMDYIMVGKFFKGLASSGAWCCFDEFNRIFIEVLSVIAQQLLQLFGVKRTLASYNDVAEMEFDGTAILMKPTFNVFITMNPGYAGRTELPDNLAALFRPMAMMVPDYGMIGEISFYAFGFESGRHLAKKMVTTFQLCSEQLSAQCHYDYGMRAVKTVIEAAGLNKRKFPDQAEAQILLRALRDVNVPKFLKDDLPLFENIISDLFPGVEKPVMDYGELENATAAVTKDVHLQPTEYFLKKQFELFDMIQVRHGMMLVGPTGGGKTCCLRALQAACTSLADPKDAESPYQKTHIHTLNPKAITQNQLYGSFDEVTREWSDGIAAELIRNAVRDNPNPDHHWIMFDGPVDALWIESMNTVLDDNKKLCLVSGEIIALTSKMRMQFEVEDLEVASPATVSRCGMIYLEPGSLGYEPIYDTWIEMLPETFTHFKTGYPETLSRLCREIIPGAITFMRKKGVEVAATEDQNIIQSLFRLLDCYFRAYIPDELKVLSSFKQEMADLKTRIVPLFFFCLIWSIGGSCDGKSRKGFSDYIWAVINEESNSVMRSELEEANVAVPKVQEGVEFAGLEVGSNVYDYFFDLEKVTWVPWMSTIPQYEVPRGARYETIVVPSIDSVRLVYIFQKLVTNSFHVLCPGPTGTGKSVNIALWLQKQAPDNFIGTFINFSAQTHVNQLQDLIDSKLEKRRRGVYGPPAGKKMVIFIDDLNMPLKEYYGAQPPIELIRQWHDHAGWFNRKELVKFSIVDAIMVSAMGPPGGGRTFITPRLKRHYSNTAYVDLSDAAITQIFDVISTYFFAPFDEQIQATMPIMITATMNVFKKALDDLLPTPAKCHYLFNLRDIWKVFLGVCSQSHKISNTPDIVIRCWCHEIQRVFGDRLTDKTDVQWMQTQIDGQLVDAFGKDPKTLFKSERLIFGSFMTSEIDNRVYEEITDMKKMKEMIEEYLDDYNQTATMTMPLVMFLDACEHSSRTCRVLAQPSGNVLLLGVGGSGRQSLTRLSAHMCDSECFQIEVAKGYGMNEFKEDVKTCLMKCGVEDKRQVFLFCDTQIVKEDFVEAINNILNSGDVPNLYAVEDFEAISTSCRSVCQQLGMQPTKANLFGAYLSRVRSNVHVVLAFSPVGDAFRNRLRCFPSLVNCCTIDWFHEWPAEALYSVAKQQILAKQVELPDLEGSLTMFKTQHQSVEVAAKRFLKETGRNVYVTPTSYLELLSSYVQLLEMKRTEVGTLQKRYSVGLTKIGDAEEQVSGLQIMLTEKKPVLEKTQKEVAEMMIVITKDKAAAEEVSAVVAAEEEGASVKAAKTQDIKDDAQRDLDEALPALEAAVQCLKKLKKDHITEVKSLNKPPAGVRLCLEAICILFQVKAIRKNDPNDPSKKIDDFWEPSQKVVLADPNKLLSQLFDYDKDNIPDAVINLLDPYIKREDFDPVAIKKASVACEALCMWARAMYTYHFVAKAVEPKRQMLREAEVDLVECQEKLEAAQSKLREVNAKIEKLESDFNAAVEQQDTLQKDMDMCLVKLERAHKLIGGLGGEKARWGQNVTDLTAAMGLLPGDCIVAAGMVAYTGPFTAGFRLQFEETWRDGLKQLNMTYTEGTSMKSCIGEPIKMQQWVVCGLPNDNLSLENGIIIDRSRRWPLMIDPQRQANKYIKNMGKNTDTGIDVCKLSQPKFLRTLELGIQFGKWILLENIGLTLDPALEPVLQQQKQKDGSGFTMKLGDKSVTYTDTFKFFMTTTLPNPHYSPEVSVKVTLLNFAITPVGLEDQMLGIVVAKERPDLEDQKNELVVQNAKMNKNLKEIEDEILRLLSASSGDVLEDDTLVDQVTSSKMVSDDINAKKEVARVTEIDIDVARESYRTVAYRTAVLFFCIVELTNIDPMYQYSLQWFQKLFGTCIDQAPQSEVLDERLSNLKNFFTDGLYQNICRGLFERHKILFSFALCIRIMKGDNQVDDAELRFLLVGPTADLVEKGPAVPAEWCGKPRWNEILTLSQLAAFQGFETYFQENLSDFEKLYDSVECDKEVLPGEWETKLSPMQRLCFLRAFRVDCLKSGVITFILNMIGQKFVEPPTFDIAKSFADSMSTTPLIFILSPGTDPVSDVIAFADVQGVGKRFESISLGQGQGPKASKMIEEGKVNGGWVFLSNCHLMESWMPSLEAIVEALNPEEMSNNFRLWLTSMPAKSFPVPILQNGVKMTNEPPVGLRANLLRSYGNIADSLFAESNKPETFKPLLFGFCFFHAVVQDRRKFGPIGWNIAYGFTPEDLAVCKQQLMLFVNQYEEVPYKVLTFLGASINYGGRVTDDKDKLLISTILKTFICPAVIEEGEDYKYSTSGKYYAPTCDKQDDFIQYIRALPLFPMPEAFGLHENCNITCAQDEAMKLVVEMQAMVLTGSGGGDGGDSKEDVMDATAASVQARLPNPFPLDVCEEKFPTLYEESMNTVVKQECLRYNKLLWQMASSLKDFRKAIKGLIVMSSELEDAGKSFFVNEVPEIWAKVGPLSLKPLSSWYLDILARVKFFKLWYDLGKAPPVFWISGIFFPQAFFTGALQNYARKFKDEIDLLSYKQSTLDSVVDAPAELTAPPENGVYVYGLFMKEPVGMSTPIRSRTPSPRCCSATSPRFGSAQ
jgi:dynein heavy chain